ncbi:nucleotide exchange factor GrpE [Phormidesmis priestleyi ULC007]|uniref:Protein GrpE n=1 Tax=Phormidesmis priestleyi ULC007 TaxID=1920490 RepID=A0A2T1DE24_9CYAN|nr:nucleotide exchange factor GrpE [Phormidesmis priestleyi]PSB18714.1 nucleotide exchange factor GrpE [Phormidesmis priestleyi ULC007]PZO51526.1 MAG: nucleotide exchange factor GrpE [Phormidesmis priestleyi]
MIDEENQLQETQASTTTSEGVPTLNPQPGESEVPQTDVQASDGLLGAEKALPKNAVEDDTDYEAAFMDLRSTFATKERELEALKAQLEDRNNQYLRIVADFENFRRRTQKEKEDLEQQIKCSTLNELLPVVDNFERARSHIKPQTDGEMNIHKSYQSVYKQLVDCLKRVGVAPMRSDGKEFDPNLHEAVMREPTSEHPEGTVIEELVRGYMLGDRVLRHAMVKVAAPPEDGEIPATAGATE